MNLQSIAFPIYTRAVGILAVFHTVTMPLAFLMALSYENTALALLAMGVVPFMATLPGSVVGLAVFRMLLKKVNPALPQNKLYSVICARALAGYGAGALATILVLGALKGDFAYLDMWAYLIVPAASTRFAVYQKRKLIYAALQDERPSDETTLL